jgi:sporulation protein YlmC with PRC-barrel domain
MNAETIKGLAVVSISTGARLGRVEDVVFDPQALRVAALRVSAAGQQALIPFDKVRALGSDAVTVPNDDVTQWDKPEGPLATMMGLDDLAKCKVVDEAGTLVGTIGAVEIDPQDGRITQLQARQGGVLGIGRTTETIAASEISSIGPDIVVIAVRPPAS